MEAGLDAPRVAPVLYLPPEELRLYSPDKDGLIPTPLDRRGLVDAPVLLQEIAKTVDPSYDWKSPFNDPHHIQWPARWYPDIERDHLTKSANPHEFRNLAISKWVLPRVLHNWIHRVTEPPPVPSDEVMYYRTEAQRVATSLFMAAKRSRLSLRSTTLTEKQIHTRLTPTYRTIARELRAMQSIPREFRLVNLSEYGVERPADVYKIETALGRCATTKTADRALRIVRRANAA